LKAFGKGKIERFFKTLRAQDTASLTALNRRLAAWIEGEYHRTPHRGLEGRTPLEQWALTGEAVRFPEPGLDLDDLFLFEAKRKVRKDRTVSLDGTVYEVDAALVGETVTLRFDPAASPGRPLQVCHLGRPSGLARPLDTYINCFVKRERPSRTLSADAPAPQPPASALRLRELPREPDDAEGRRCTASTSPSPPFPSIPRPSRMRCSPRPRCARPRRG
jgi:hypothetical protein